VDHGANLDTHVTRFRSEAADESDADASHQHMTRLHHGASISSVAPAGESEDLMPSIFISYRRDDVEGHAGRLYEDLVTHFGKGAVFMDVAGIDPGLDFRR
jgi:hypothetical protein